MISVLLAVFVVFLTSSTAIAPDELSSRNIGPIDENHGSVTQINLGIDASENANIVSLSDIDTVKVNEGKIESINIGTLVVKGGRKHERERETHEHERESHEKEPQKYRYGPPPRQSGCHCDQLEMDDIGPIGINTGTVMQSNYGSDASGSIGPVGIELGTQTKNTFVLKKKKHFSSKATSASKIADLISELGGYEKDGDDNSNEEDLAESEEDDDKLVYFDVPLSSFADEKVNIGTNEGLIQSVNIGGGRKNDKRFVGKREREHHSRREKERELEREREIRRRREKEIHRERERGHEYGRRRPEQCRC